MTKRMLIDATHAEETRVVVLDENRIDDFDVESQSRKQLKGNIYLAKVVRVEPSLQAAFVEYGGGRHGFLAFGEIHPDYYQIPVADRQRLLRMQEEEARAEDEADDADSSSPAVESELEPQGEHEGAITEAATDSRSDIDLVELEQPAPELREPEALVPPRIDEPDDGVAADDRTNSAEAFDLHPDEPPEVAPPTVAEVQSRVDVSLTIPDAAVPETEQPGPNVDGAADHEPSGPAQPAAIARDEMFGAADAADLLSEISDSDSVLPDAPHTVEAELEPAREFDVSVPPEPPLEEVGGDTDSGEGAEDARRRRESRLLRSYRIQEVIRRRQILLIQVVKEERGSKGAALTTYISLAGRYCVLMPNSPRGGGVSRKITSASDRKRLREVTAELDLPRGMGLIVRTAGANRPKPEILRDGEYLMRLWDDIREHTLRSTAPALIYEEASLIKRAIRDVYSRDIDEILVDGEPAWRAAHDFMRMLMPSHASKVRLWRGENGQPLFARYQVEAQLDAMLSRTVQLKSGGYLVIDETEALVAIDVNSGRATRERNVEETAFRTNLEAADEAARQLRLRDLAGLIVIDFIDMESRKNNATVERRLKEALREDRARIQIGSISHFGLLEMSRQRLRPSLAETSFVTCAHCGGTGRVRSPESAAIHVLRDIEDEGGKARASVIMVHAAGSVVMYLLNNKRERLIEIEARTQMRVQFTIDDTLVPPACRIDRLRPRITEDRPAPVVPAAPPPEQVEIEAEEIGLVEPPAPPAEVSPTAVPGHMPSVATANGSAAEREEGERRRRRRRRRRGRRDGVTSTDGLAVAGEGAEGDGEGDDPGDDVEGVEQQALPVSAVDVPQTEAPVARPDDDPDRRRGRRGGRRRQRDDEMTAPAPYIGPTPADPFAGAGFDIFDLMDADPEITPPRPEPPAAVTKISEPVSEASRSAPESGTNFAEAASEPADPPMGAMVTEPAGEMAEPVAKVLPGPEEVRASESEVASPPRAGDEGFHQVNAQPPEFPEPVAPKAEHDSEAKPLAEQMLESTADVKVKPTRKRAPRKPRLTKAQVAAAEAAAADVSEAESGQNSPVSESSGSAEVSAEEDSVSPAPATTAEQPTRKRGWWKR